MRHISTAVCVACITLVAGTASAQVAGEQKITITFGGQLDAAAPSVANVADMLAGIDLSQAQKDSITKLDNIQKRAGPDHAATHVATVRALLTPEQQKQFDANAAKTKKQGQGDSQSIQLILQGSGDDDALKKLDDPKEH